MNYNRLVLLVMVLISTLQVGAMEHEQLVKKTTLPTLISVDRKRIDAYKEQWKNWEQTRAPRRKTASYLGIMAVIAGGGFFGYKLWKEWQKPDEPEAEANVKNEDFNDLTQRVLALELNPPQPVDPNAQTFTQKLFGKAKDLFFIGRTMALGLAVPIVKFGIIGSGADVIRETISHSPLSRNIVGAGDYLFRQRTMLWLLENECSLRLSLLNIKKVLNSTSTFLQGSPVYRSSLIVAINMFVKETEKMVGHMGFVKEQLSPELTSDSEHAEVIIETVINTLERLQQATEGFIVASGKSFDSMDAFIASFSHFLKGLETSIDTILDQIELFEAVQSAAGLLEASGKSNAVECKVAQLRAILQPTKKSDDQDYASSQEDFVQQVLFKAINDFYIAEGMKRIVKKEIPLLTSATK